MTRFKLDLAPALAALLGQPAALVAKAGTLAAKRGAEEYSDAIHDWVNAGRAYQVDKNTTLQATGWHAQGDGALVYSNGPYAAFLEFGTGLHGPKRKTYRIEPKAGRQALRWMVGGPGGGYRFSRGLDHPGMKPRPFFFADQEARREQVLAAMREAVAEVLGAHA